MDVIAMIQAVGSAVANYFGWAKQRSDLKNQADVKSAAVNQSDQDRIDSVNKAIAKGDEKSIRDIIAE